MRAGGGHGRGRAGGRARTGGAGPRRGAAAARLWALRARPVSSGGGGGTCGGSGGGRGDGGGAGGGGSCGGGGGPPPEGGAPAWSALTLGGSLCLTDFWNFLRSNDLLLFLLCVAVPCLGVYAKYRRVDKYFVTAFVGMCLGWAPGVVLALLFVFGGVRF